MEVEMALFDDFSNGRVAEALDHNLLDSVPKKGSVIASREAKAKQDLEDLKLKHLQRAVEALKNGQTHLTSAPDNEEVISFIRSYLAPAGWVVESKTTPYKRSKKKGGEVPSKTTTLYFK